MAYYSKLLGTRLAHRHQGASACLGMFQELGVRTSCTVIESVRDVFTTPTAGSRPDRLASEPGVWWYRV